MADEKVETAGDLPSPSTFDFILLSSVAVTSVAGKPIHGVVIRIPMDDPTVQMAAEGPRLTGGLARLVELVKRKDRALLVVHSNSPLRPSKNDYDALEIDTTRLKQPYKDISAWVERVLSASGADQLILFHMRGAVRHRQMLTADPVILDDKTPLVMRNVTGTSDMLQRTFWTVDPLSNPFANGRVNFSCLITNQRHEFGFTLPPAILRTLTRPSADYTGDMGENDSAKEIMRRLQNKDGRPIFPLPIVARNGAVYRRFSLAWFLLAFDWYIKDTKTPLNLFPSTSDPYEIAKSTASMKKITSALQSSKWPLMRLCKYADGRSFDLRFFVRLHVCDELQVRRKLGTLTKGWFKDKWVQDTFKYTDPEPDDNDDVEESITSDATLTEFSVAALIKDEADKSIPQNSAEILSVCDTHHLLVAGDMKTVMDRNWRYRPPRHNEKEGGRTSTLQFMYHFEGKDRYTMKLVGKKRTEEGLFRERSKRILEAKQVLNKADIVDLLYNILYKENEAELTEVFRPISYSGLYKQRSVYRPPSSAVNLQMFEVYMGKDLVVQINEADFFHMGVWTPLTAVPPELFGDGKTTRLELLDDADMFKYGKAPVAPSLRRVKDTSNPLIPVAMNNTDSDIAELPDTERILVLAVSPLISNCLRGVVDYHFVGPARYGEANPFHAVASIEVDFETIAKLSSLAIHPALLLPEDNPRASLFDVDDEDVVTSRFSNKTYKAGADEAFEILSGQKKQISHWLDTGVQKPRLIVPCPLSMSDDGGFNVPDRMEIPSWDSPISKDGVFLGQRSSDVPTLSKNKYLYYGVHMVVVVRVEDGSLILEKYLQSPLKKGWSVYEDPYLYYNQ